MAHKFHVGIDPDSDKHGVAFFVDGVLCSLANERRHDIIAWALKQREAGDEISFSLEDVMHNQFVYKRNESENTKVQSRIAMFTGRCQQAFVELIRDLEEHGFLYTKFPPQKDNWAKHKAQFELVTGWKGESNADTRSSAYFGFLGLKK